METPRYAPENLIALNIEVHQKARLFDRVVEGGPPEGLLSVLDSMAQRVEDLRRTAGHYVLVSELLRQLDVDDGGRIAGFWVLLGDDGSAVVDLAASGDGGGMPDADTSPDRAETRQLLQDWPLSVRDLDRLFDARDWVSRQAVLAAAPDGDRT